MKLHFEPDLDFQLAAIEAVCDLFRGQETCRTEFTVTKSALDGAYFAGLESDLGIGNRLSLHDDEILANLRDVQLRNGLPPSESLASGDFTVEMETGTGKTYVYLRTILELRRRYGFTKFVVVVPSVAIKEGVYKSIQMTAEHFRELYAGEPFDYFIYDSSKLGQVRNFATSPNIQIMIVTVGAINKKDVNNLYKDSEKTGGEKPIDLIRSTRPIVIVDEPQSVDGGLQGRGKEALGAMHPLCTLRYSATHADKHHMVYRLDAVDAYEKRLVKQIEVASATVDGGHNRPFVRLVSVTSKKNSVTARIEVDVLAAKSVARREVTVEDGDDLEQITKREIYADCRVGEIVARRGAECVELRVPGGEVFLKPGEAWGDVNESSVRREMIRRTIKEHLDKEKRLRPRGIKVLSLFFVDAVEKYRRYDQNGNAQKGEYAVMFEEEYRRAARHPDYQSLFHEVDLTRAADEVHDGYFSIDRKKVGTRTVDVFRDTLGNTQVDEGTYRLIMRDKERLLSFETPLKFIFSHSALREGWDNPNVFQICALRDIRTERERRQSIGRGLRLCVNQDGQRLRGFDVNTLTVVATESYEQFAENLQKEIESETGIRFGIVEKHQFAAISTAGPDGRTQPLGFERSESLWRELHAQGYIDARGAIQDTLRLALKDKTLALPEDLADQHSAIGDILRKLAGRLEIKNADDRRSVRVVKERLYSPEFTELWERIKHKSTYRVEFDNEKLIDECIRAVTDAPPVPRTRLQWRKADVAIGRAGVAVTERDGAATVLLDEGDLELPDILTELQDRTRLTRRSIARILIGSGRLNDFGRNPQAFIDLVAEAIHLRKNRVLVDGIKYQRLGDGEYYAQALFEAEELSGYLRNMVAAPNRCLYEEVVWDSRTEADFARELDRNSAVKVFVKLPNWFQVPTPLGTYNPDWAVLVEAEEGDRVYFVVETKSGLFADELRSKESGKITCGTAHFHAIAAGDNPAQFVVATSADDVIVRALERSKSDRSV